MADCSDSGLVPTALVAVAVSVYAVPLVRSSTVHVRAVLVSQVSPPGVAVTVYPLMGVPPVNVGAVHDAVT